MTVSFHHFQLNCLRILKLCLQPALVACVVLLLDSAHTHCEHLTIEAHDFSLLYFQCQEQSPL